MTRRFIALLASLPLALTSSGCLLSRAITDIGAHDSFNSYKVQTTSRYYGVFSSWVTLDVWSCHKDGDTFHCTELDYERSKQGIKRPEQAGAAPMPGAVAVPAAVPVPVPVPMPMAAPVPVPVAAPVPVPVPAPGAVPVRTAAPVPAAAPAAPVPATTTTRPGGAR